jgi:5-methylcytosine-specific restriction endonuclease McrA
MTERTKSQMPDTLAQKVKLTKKEIQARYYARHKEKILAKQAAYKAEHPGEVKAAKDKFRTKNREKRNAKYAKYAAENKDAIREKQAKERIEKRGMVLAREARYRELNREKVRESRQRFRDANPDYDLVNSQNRRKRIAGAKLPKGIYTRLLKLQQGMCACCKKKLDEYHLDHVIPLAMGGEHHETNVQLLCPPCNLSKGAKHPVDFMQSRGFLL